MAGLHHLTRPTIAGKLIARPEGLTHRHAEVWGAADIYDNVGHVGTAITFDVTGPGGLLNGPQTNVAKADGPGAFAEWNLGLLELTCDWTVVLSGWGGPSRGIVRYTLNGSAIGADRDTYFAAATFWQESRMWTPAAGQGTTAQVLRAEVVGKNAAATAYDLNVVQLVLSRGNLAATIAQYPAL